MFIKGLLNLIMNLPSTCEELVSQCLCTSSFMGCIALLKKKKWGNSSTLSNYTQPWNLWRDRKKSVLVSFHTGALIYYNLYISNKSFTKYDSVNGNRLWGFLFCFVFNLIYLFCCIGVGSLVTACGIWFPGQELNLGPLHWEHWVLATGPPGKSPRRQVLSATLVQNHW